MPRLIQIVIVAAAIATATGAVVFALRDTGIGEPIQIVPPSTAPTPTALLSFELKVYLTGAVYRPGLYAVKEGDRLAEVIALAGGTTEDADLLAVNMAVRVKDQDHVHVPKVGEESPTATVAGQSPASNGNIDINTADAELLETLPGIGEVRAKAVVQYREQNGPFNRVDDIVAVSGIGAATLEGIRDLIAVR